MAWTTNALLANKRAVLEGPNVVLKVSLPPPLRSQKNITFIANADVRDAILNLTLTALAPKFPVFQTSDYELWFQINLVVLLASFRPSVLVVIPTNLTCDSYDAM